MYPFLEGLDSRLTMAESIPLPKTSDSVLSKGLMVSTVHRSFLYENQDLLPKVSSGTLEAFRAIGASFEMRTLALRLFSLLPDSDAGSLSQQMALHVTKTNEAVRESEWLRQGTQLGEGEKKNGIWSTRTAVDQLHQIVGWLVLVGQWSAAAELLPSLQMPLHSSDWPDPVSSALSSFGQQNVEWEFEESGPDHAREFLCRIRVRGRRPIEGFGKSKKQARAEAALRALESYAAQPSKDPKKSRKGAVRVIHEPPSSGSRWVAFVAEILDVDQGQYYWVEQALIHSSWMYENQRIAEIAGQRDNTRLAWLGSHTVNFDSAVASATRVLQEELLEYAFRTTEAEQHEAAAYVCGLPSRMFLGRGQTGSVSRQMAADAFQAVHAVKALSRNEESPFSGATGPWAQAALLVAPGTPKGVDEKTDLQELAQAIGLDLEYDDEFRGSEHSPECRGVITLRSEKLRRKVGIGGPWKSGKTQAHRAAAGRVLKLIAPVLMGEESEHVSADSAQGRLMAFVLLHLHAQIPSRPKDVGVWLRKGLFGLRSRMTPDELTRALSLWEERCRRLNCPWLDEEQLEKFIFAALQGIPADSSLDARVSEEVRELSRLCSDDTAEDFPFDSHIDMISGLANLLRIRSRVGEPSQLKSDIADLALLLRSDVIEQEEIDDIPDEACWTSGSSEALSFLLRQIKKSSPDMTFVQKVHAVEDAICLTIDEDLETEAPLIDVFVPTLQEIFPNLNVVKSSRATTVSFAIRSGVNDKLLVENVYMAWRDRLRPIDTKMAEGLHAVKNSLAAAKSLKSQNTLSRREQLEQELAVRQHLDEAARLLTQMKWRSNLASSDQSLTCNLSAEVNAFVRDALPGLGDGCQLNSSIPGVPIAVPMSSVELQIVLSNLFKNAHEAIEGSGEITVAVRNIGSTALLEVGDDGPGFSAAVEATLDRRPSATSKIGGSGLGLSTIRRMVERAGGSITFETLGIGTLVRVELPTEVGDSPEKES